MITVNEKARKKKGDGEEMGQNGSNDDNLDDDDIYHIIDSRLASIPSPS